MWSPRAFIVVIALACLLAIPLYSYRQFLLRGMRPPLSTIMLDEMEKTGVPSFTLPDLGGKEQGLEQYKGKVVILNFWASWCAPCVKEFPSLQRLANKFPNDIVIVAVSHDNNEEDLMSFLDSFGGRASNFHILWDKDRSVGKRYGTQVLPETFIIGRDFRLKRKVAGIDEWDNPFAIRYFEDLVKQ